MVSSFRRVLLKQSVSAPSANSAKREGDRTRSRTAGSILVDRVDCLVGAPLAYGLTQAQLRELASAADDVWYSRGQTIFLQDDPVRQVFVIATGTVKITQVSEVGNEILLRLERCGDLLDDVIGVSQRHSLTAHATESCCLLVWGTSVFEALLTRIPAIERNTTAIMRSRLRSLEERFCDVSTCRVPQRLARLVIKLAKDRVTDSRCSAALSREEMAQMTGTSSFTVSRLLSEWADSDILTLDRKKVLIEDVQRLLEIADAA